MANNSTPTQGASSQYALKFVFAAVSSEWGRPLVCTHAPTGIPGQTWPPQPQQTH